MFPEAFGSEVAKFYQSLPHHKERHFTQDLYIKYPLTQPNSLWRFEKFVNSPYNCQVHPSEYFADMNKNLGFVLKHDDSVNDRYI